MRLAVLGDIHGNLRVLEAVIEHAERARIDSFVIVGDIVVGTPESLACWERVKALQCPMLRGNHESYVASFYDDPVWQTPQFAPVAWAVAQLGDVARRELGALPFDLDLPEAPELRFVHASLAATATTSARIQQKPSSRRCSRR